MRHDSQKADFQTRSELRGEVEDFRSLPQNKQRLGMWCMVGRNGDYNAALPHLCSICVICLLYLSLDSAEIHRRINKRLECSDGRIKICSYWGCDHTGQNGRCPEKSQTPFSPITDLKAKRAASHDSCRLLGVYATTEHS